MLPFLLARTDNYAARKLSVIFYPQRKKVASEELFQINSKLHDPRRDEPERDQIASSKDMDVSKFADLRRCVPLGRPLLFECTTIKSKARLLPEL